MVKDIGDLSKLLMAYNSYRDSLDGEAKEKLKHELADVLYSLLVIANKTEVDLEESFWKTMDDIEKEINEN